jgi:predicted  nucleic acid-binding Zn-ribbon protein
MKRITIILAASTLMFACNETSKKNSQDVAQVQNVEQIKKMTIDSMRMQAQIKDTKQAVIDSMNSVAKFEKAKTFTLDSLKASKKETQVVTKRTYQTVKKDNDVVAYKDNSESTTTTTTSTPAKVYKKKRKISRTAEGAIIGAGVGAVSGAIINKSNRGKGAIIGGVIGAGVGAGTGAVLDKKAKKKEMYW